MANIVFNIGLGRVNELFRRVKENDPSEAAIILVPLETSGLESDAVLRDKDTLAQVLAGSTNEQSTMGRKVLTQDDIAITSPDIANDRNEAALPTVTWVGATGNAISKILVCFRRANADGDGLIIPLCMFDFAITPDGSDVVMTGGTVFRASQG